MAGRLRGLVRRSRLLVGGLDLYTRSVVEWPRNMIAVPPATLTRRSTEHGPGQPILALLVILAGRL
jgi:hypothetical protein